MEQSMNVGEVVYVKSSEEPVIVLNVRKLRNEELGKKFPAEYNGPDTVVTVRRPQMTESQGITYQIYDFLQVELETSAEQSNRLYAKIIERQKLAMSEVNADGPFGSPSKIVKPS
jgi:hypothetical protein